MKNIVKVIIILLVINAGTIAFSLFVITNPVPSATELGWPLTYYERFRLSGSSSDNHGWYPDHFFYDQVIYLVASVIVVFIFNRVKGTTSQRKKVNI